MDITEQRVSKLEHMAREQAFVLMLLTRETTGEAKRMAAQNFSNAWGETLPIENASQLYGLLNGPTDNVMLIDDTGEKHLLSEVVGLGDNESVVGAFIGMDYPHPKMVSAWLHPHYSMDDLIERAAEHNP